MNQKVKCFKIVVSLGLICLQGFAFLFEIHYCCETGCKPVASSEGCSLQSGSIAKEQESLCDPSDI